jgi:hypothetical protein
MYRHDNYTTIEKGVVVEHPFITKWIGFTNPNIRAFKDIECYPNVFLCPENVYNSWSAFDMEFVDSYEPDQEGLEFMLNHILILCAKDKVVYDYFVQWIAHAIQFPEQKCGVAPVFISGEGAGKGSLMGLLRKMLGEKKCWRLQLRNEMCGANLIPKWLIVSLLT